MLTPQRTTPSPGEQLPADRVRRRWGSGGACCSLAKWPRRRPRWGGYRGWNGAEGAPSEAVRDIGRHRPEMAAGGERQTAGEGDGDDGDGGGCGGRERCWPAAEVVAAATAVQVPPPPRDAPDAGQALLPPWRESRRQPGSLSSTDGSTRNGPAMLSCRNPQRSHAVAAVSLAAARAGGGNVTVGGGGECDSGGEGAREGGGGAGLGGQSGHIEDGSFVRKRARAAATRAGGHARQGRGASPCARCRGEAAPLAPPPHSPATRSFSSMATAPRALGRGVGWLPHGRDHGVPRCVAERPHLPYSRRESAGRRRGALPPPCPLRSRGAPPNKPLCPPPAASGAPEGERSIVLDRLFARRPTGGG